MESQLVTAKYVRADEIKPPGLRTEGNPINIHTLNTSVDPRPVLDGRSASLPRIPRGKRHKPRVNVTILLSRLTSAQGRSPKLRLNLLPSRPHKETLLPPRRPRHRGPG